MIKINTTVKNAAHQSKRYMQKKAFWNDSHNKEMWNLTEDVMKVRDRLSLRAKLDPEDFYQNIDGTAGAYRHSKEFRTPLLLQGTNAMYKSLKIHLKEQADKIRPLIEKPSRM